jgi:hypothetical protein
MTANVVSIEGRLIICEMLMHLNGNIEIFYFRLFDDPEVLIAIL